MSLQVSGKCQVYRVEDKGKFVTATLRTSKKNQQDEWESEFFNAKFVGKAAALAVLLADKDKLEITKAILENRKYNEKQYISVVVFEFEVVDREVAQGDSYEEDIEGELPF